MRTTLPQRIIQWVYSNYAKFDKSTFIAMAIKDILKNTWLLGMTSEKMAGNELALFALCQIYHRHAMMYTSEKNRCSISIDGNIREDFLRN